MRFLILCFKPEEQRRRWARHFRCRDAATGATPDANRRSVVEVGVMEAARFWEVGGKWRVANPSVQPEPFNGHDPQSPLSASSSCQCAHWPSFVPLASQFFNLNLVEMSNWASRQGSSRLPRSPTTDCPPMMPSFPPMFPPAWNWFFTPGYLLPTQGIWPQEPYWTYWMLCITSIPKWYNLLQVCMVLFGFKLI